MSYFSAANAIKTKQPEPPPAKRIRNRHSLDEIIRSHGYKIIARPADAEPVWLNKDGVRLKQSHVLKLIDK